jgi:hypothetical protein
VITVRISLFEMVSCNPTFFQMNLLKRLRDAGIPIKGILLFQGLERGVLAEETDINGGLLYTWSEDE